MLNMFRYFCLKIMYIKKKFCTNLKKKQKTNIHIYARSIVLKFGMYFFPFPRHNLSESATPRSVRFYLPSTEILCKTKHIYIHRYVCMYVCMYVYIKLFIITYTQYILRPQLKFKYMYR